MIRNVFKCPNSVIMWQSLLPLLLRRHSSFLSRQHTTNFIIKIHHRRNLCYWLFVLKEVMTSIGDKEARINRSRALGPHTCFEASNTYLNIHSTVSLWQGTPPPSIHKTQLLIQQTTLSSRCTNLHSGGR